MNKNTRILTLVISLLITVGFASTAYATVPVLFVANTGSGDNVQVTVTGDSNASVTLYYTGSNSGTQNSYIGTTNSSGYLSTIISTATYGIIPNSSVYIIVNGQTSLSIVWPYSSQTTGLIYFSQSNPTLSVGQTTIIYVSGGSANNYYISSNSNSSIVQATIIGNSLSLYGSSNNGSAVISVCSSNYVCSSITATVGSYNNNGIITLSQTNVSLIPGQSASVSIFGNGGYYFSNNLSQNIVSSSISGSNLVIYANSYGNVNVTVCQTGGQCAIAYVVVSTNNNQNNTNTGTSFLTFSQASPTLSIGQSMTITISGGNYVGVYYNSYNNYNYYIPYNSDPNTAQTSISGNTLTITGRKNGSVVIVVCDSASNCGPVSATVGINNIYPIVYNNYSGYTFTRFLTIGSTGDDVTALQQILTDIGYYGGAIGGHYGSLTASAVRRYQAANGLQQTGNVGPSTMNVLNNQAGSGMQE